MNGVLWMELHVVSHPRRGNEMVAFDSSRRLKPTAAELDLLRARCPLVKLGECNVLRIEIWGSSDRSAPNPHFDEAGSGGSGVGSGAAAAVANPHSAAPAANPHFDAKSTAAPTAVALLLVVPPAALNENVEVEQVFRIWTGGYFGGHS